jgi:DNA-binding NarL/FixJ family response regulator
MVNNYKILLLDEETLTRQGISRIIKDYESFKIVGEASNINQAIRWMHLERPDLIIADIPLVDSQLEQLCRTYQTQILLLSRTEQIATLQRKHLKYVAGYVSKSDTSDELIKALRTLASGRKYFSEHFFHKFITQTEISEEDSPYYAIQRLSARERQIVELICQGYRTKEIASMLFLSEKTVSNHRANILDKCEVKNTIELIQIYSKMKLRDAS